MEIKALLSGVIEKYARPDNPATFWVLQGLGWFAFSLITFFTLTVWYEQVRIQHVLHIGLQAIVGIILTLPLRYIGHRVWKENTATLVALNILAVAVFAIAWTVLRMQTFLWIAEEYDIWADFGGWAFGSIFVFTSWMAFYHAIKTFYNYQEEKEALRQTELQAREEKILRLTAENLAQENRVKILRYQDNPHFLFNSLNALTGLISMKRGDEAVEMIQSLSALLRFSLDLDPLDKIPLHKEVEVVDQYMTMQRIRYGESLVFEQALHNGTEQELVPNLILLPIFENIFKHAFPHHVPHPDQTFCIRLTASRSGTRLMIAVENSGRLTEDDLKKILSDKPSKSIGLRNLKERLQVIYGPKVKFGADVSELGGAKIEMEINTA
ncbi:MAG: sensor histidine kinase [Parvibaculales bacterium]